MQDWQERYKREISLALVGMVLIGAGVFWIKGGVGEETKIEVIKRAGERESGRAGVVKLNINVATSEELVALPGIGEVTAGKIIAGRPYGSIGELVDRKIVSSKVIEQIKDRVDVE